MKRLSLIALSAAALVALVAAGAVFRDSDTLQQVQLQAVNPAQEDPAAASAPEPQPAEFGGSFSLTDQYGNRRTDADFRGKFMLIFFGYTYCPDICPTTLAIEAEALDKLGPLANRIAPIFITVDPKRDTADKLKSYLAAFDAKPPSERPNFVGLTGSDEEIANAAKAYRVFYQAHLDARAPDGSDYSVDHTSDVYLMSPDGKFVAYYSAGILADELAADLMARLSP